MAAVDHGLFDYIVTLCASCASHLKHGYPRALAADPQEAAEVEHFGAKVTHVSVSLTDVLKLDTDAFSLTGARSPTMPPATCAGAWASTEAPRDLIASGRGTTSCRPRRRRPAAGSAAPIRASSPRSRPRFSSKLDDVMATGAGLLVTECPGCVMQLRGGAKNAGLDLDVSHIAELLAARMRSSTGEKHE